MTKKLSEPKYARCGVAIFMYNDDHKYLLSTKSKVGQKNVWSLPGGPVLYSDEGMREALHRNVLAETGMKINYASLMENLPTTQFMYPNGDKFMIFFYHGPVFPGSANEPLIKKPYQTRWFKKEDFPKKLMKPVPRAISLARLCSDLF